MSYTHADYLRMIEEMKERKLYRDFDWQRVMKWDSGKDVPHNQYGPDQHWHEIELDWKHFRYDIGEIRF